MIHGLMEYVVGDQTRTMHPEDCLYFDARIPHGPKLEKTWTARYLVNTRVT